MADPTRPEDAFMVQARAACEAIVRFHYQCFIGLPLMQDSKPVDHTDLNLAAQHAESALRIAGPLALPQAAPDPRDEIFAWLLGQRGSFPDEPPPLAGKYRQRFWWRSELAKRLEAIGVAPQAAEPCPDLLNDLRELERLYDRDGIAQPAATQIEKIFDRWLHDEPSIESKRSTSRTAKGADC